MNGYKQPAETKQQTDDWFGLVEGFAGYFSKPDITAITPNYLVPPSKNVYVDYGLRAISRPGYILYNQANTGGSGMVGSYEWETSTTPDYSLRTYGTSLEFDWNGTYNSLLSNIQNPNVEFAKVLDFNEQQDVLLFVLGNSFIYRWSGGATKVRSSTTTTLTKQGVLGSQLTQLGTFTVTVASPGVFSMTNTLVAGNVVQFFTTGALPTGILPLTNYYVISTGLSSSQFEVSTTLGGSAVNTSGSQSGTHTVYLVNNTNGASISFTASPTPGTAAATISDSNNNFLNAGFAAGDSLTVTGSANNDGNYVIASVVAGKISLEMSNTLITEAVGQSIVLYNQTGPTWKSARFFSTISGRAIIYKGVVYAYTGGENTDTLTGLSSFPAVTAGDVTWQQVATIPLPSAITTPFPGFYPNLIGVQLNMVYLGSTSSQMIFGSAANDYTNYTLTSPRAQGDPMQEPLTSGPATCIIPVDTNAQILNVQSSLVFGAGIDAFDQIDFHMSADNTEELARIIRYKTATSAGLISKDAICPIKNNTVYISREPALDSLSESNLESPDGKKNVPISDPIKNDFDSYNFQGAHIKYWKRAIWIALPAEGLVLMYDMMRNIWQPPFTIPVSRLAIINDWLYGHSAVTNETYRLWTGTNDNGSPIRQIARCAYNNGGRRDRLKNFSTYWTDGYISSNGVLALNLYYGYAGSLAKLSLPIYGNDTAIVTGRTASPFGRQQFGLAQFGGGDPNSPGGLQENSALLRFEQMNTVPAIDHFEHFAEYQMNTLDGQFAVVAHGADTWDASTSAISYKK